jgi:uncharacterized protein involved in exopolysaccharide biosynthesis
MERDEIYLIDLWRILAREWRWFLGLLLLALVGTLAFTHLAKRQWEATAWIQIGQVGQVPQGQDPKIEPLARVMERLQTNSFQNEVLRSIGLAPTAAESRLYRKSLKLEPLPYAGPLIRLSVRGVSRDQAREFAEATVNQLRVLHLNLQATPLALARARLAEVETDLNAATADRDRLLRVAAPGNKDEAASKSGGPDAALAGILLASKNEDIRNLNQTRSEIVARLSSSYTYETSMMWPVYVPLGETYPNLLLTWGFGILAGISLGAIAAVARNAARRSA